jgi:hypothetical protein
MNNFFPHTGNSTSLVSAKLNFRVIKLRPSATSNGPKSPVLTLEGPLRPQSHHSAMLRFI